MPPRAKFTKEEIILRKTKNKEVPKTDIPIYPNNNPRLKNNNKLFLIYLIVVSIIGIVIIYIKNNKQLKYKKINN